MSEDRIVIPMYPGEDGLTATIRLYGQDFTGKVVEMEARPFGRGETCNTYLRANWASFADALVDVGGDATIGAPGADANPTYHADGVHLTSAGYAIVAALVAAAITSLA